MGILDPKPLTVAAGNATYAPASGSPNYAPKNAVEKIDATGTHTAATFAVRLDANGDVDALVLNGVDL